jgi:dTDP-4-amino-4,6-dideoxygalactose transaminase
LVPSLPSAGELLPWLQQIDRNRRYSNRGPLCEAFEQELAALAGAARAISVSSGTLGLELALGALGLKPGVRVLLPALTFPATASAITRSDLTPVFVDVDPETLSLTPEIACSATVESPIAAVLPVALHGHVHNAKEWDAFTERTGIPVLIDAAGTAGYQKIGITTSAVFSLHATKPLAIGEGGFVATASSDFAERIRVRSNFGFEAGVVRHPGTNAKLSEYHAAVGMAALANWSAKKALRQARYEAYAKALDHSKLRRAMSLATRSSASPNLCVRLHEGLKPRHIELLSERQIETRRWYWPPLHRHPAFAHCERASALGTTERLSDQLLGLPFHLSLEPKDIARISEALCAILEER